MKPTFHPRVGRSFIKVIATGLWALSVLFLPPGAGAAEEQDPLPALANLKRIHRDTSAKYNELIIKFGPRDGRTLVAAKRIQDLNARIAHYTRLINEQNAAATGPGADGSVSTPIAAPSDTPIIDEPVVFGDASPVDDPVVPLVLDPVLPIVTVTPAIPISGAAGSTAPQGPAADTVAIQTTPVGVPVSDVTALPVPQDDFGLVLSWSGDLILSQYPGGPSAGVSLGHGQIVKVIERNGDWVRISTGPGVDGWVTAGSVSLQTSLPLPPPLADIAPPPAAANKATDVPANPAQSTPAVPAASVKTPAASPATASVAQNSVEQPVKTPDPAAVTPSNGSAVKTGSSVDEIAGKLKSALVAGKGKITANPGAIKGSKFESTAPGKVVVAVPKRTQFAPENGQYQNSWCGPTSLGMIFEYYGIKRTTASIAKNTYNFKDRNGTPSAKLVEEARKQGFAKSRVETGKSISFLEETCSKGRPVIVNVDVAWKSGHYMVVVGVTADKIIVNDPGRTQVRREFDKAWFMTQWKGRENRVVVIE